MRASRRLLTLGPDNEPLWVCLNVYPLAESWAAAILADGAPPPKPGSLTGMAFFGKTPEQMERLALEYLGESVSQWAQRLRRDHLPPRQRYP